MKRQSRPFMILGVLHLILLIFTFFHKKQKTLVLLCSSIGIAYVFEYFVLNVFKMYTYYPKVFKNKWVDSVFGALLSQAVFVPIMGTFLAFFKFSGKWRIFASLLFGVVEKVFIKWGIFKNLSWRTKYTIAAMPYYFNIVNHWNKGLQNPNAKVMPAISLFFYFWVNYTNIYFFLLAVSKQFLFRLGFSKDIYWEHFIILPIYTFIQSLIGTISTKYNNMNSTLTGLFTLHIMDQMFFKFKIIKAKKWNPFTFFPVHAAMFLIGKYFNKLILKYREEKNVEAK